MAKARVQLQGAESFDGRGKKFVKGKPQIITNAADIEYYQRHAAFTVSMLTTVKPKEPAEPEKKKADAPAADPHSIPSLNKLTKAALIKLGALEFALDIDPALKKDDMVAAILKAVAGEQDEGEGDESEDDESEDDESEDDEGDED